MWEAPQRLSEAGRAGVGILARQSQSGALIGEGDDIRDVVAWWRAKEDEACGIDEGERGGEERHCRQRQRQWAQPREEPPDGGGRRDARRREDGQSQRDGDIQRHADGSQSGGGQRQAEAADPFDGEQPCANRDGAVAQGVGLPAATDCAAPHVASLLARRLSGNSAR